jgi:mono/diheme cytochrome c family protein
MQVSRILFFYITALLIQSCGGNPYQQGQNLYTVFCANCHMDDGTGLEGLIPPLANSDWLRERQKEVACLIRYGIQDTLTVNGERYGQPMAGIDRLTDTEITNIVNYINHAWGNRDGVVKFEDLRDQLEQCPEAQR